MAWSVLTRSPRWAAVASAALLSPAAFPSVAHAEPTSAESPTSPAPPPASAVSPPSAEPPAASAVPVRIGTSDGRGLVYLDDRLVGEGSFAGDLAPGTYRLRITRDGYEPFEEALVVEGPLARTVTLSLLTDVETGPVHAYERLEGVYGGFTLLGMLTPGGTGNSIEQQCERPPSELVSCDAGGGIGGGVGGFIGYHWDPVGMELFVTAQYDTMSMRNDWDAASTDPGIGPDPARTEDFTLRRVGGAALARVRLTHRWSKISASFALGAGLSLRVMSLQRLTEAKDGSGARDLFVSDSPSYLSPIVGFEPSVSFRLSSGTALTAGAQLHLDAPATFLNGREGPTTEAGGRHSLGLRGLSTPSYELASNMQIFVGPFVGMTFGP